MDIGDHSDQEDLTDMVLNIWVSTFLFPCMLILCSCSREKKMLCKAWKKHKTKGRNNVNNLLEQCTDSSNGNQSHPLYHLTNITKLLQYNIDSLHDPKYLVAPKVLLFFFFKFSSSLKKRRKKIKPCLSKWCFCFY